jgi:hypothetical protein
MNDTNEIEIPMSMFKNRFTSQNVFGDEALGNTEARYATTTTRPKISLQTNLKNESSESESSSSIMSDLSYSSSLSVPPSPLSIGSDDEYTSSSSSGETLLKRPIKKERADELTSRVTIDDAKTFSSGYKKGQRAIVSKEPMFVDELKANTLILPEEMVVEKEKGYSVITSDSSRMNKYLAQSFFKCARCNIRVKTEDNYGQWNCIAHVSESPYTPVRLFKCDHIRSTKEENEIYTYVPVDFFTHIKKNRHDDRYSAVYDSYGSKFIKIRRRKNTPILCPGCHYVFGY